MDKLANRLRRDADRIEVTVSEELERRLDASLQAATPQDEIVRRPKSGRPALFWWASSLTGIAAAAAVIVIVNIRQPQEELPPATPANIVAAVPVIDWKTESAMLTGPLQQELEDLQSDIRKAERQVREDIGL